MTFRDPSSSTDARLYRTEHYKFDWTVDFTESVIRGSASLTVTKLHLKAGAPLILDVNGLDIQTVKVGNTLVHWKILPNPTAALGSSLEIEIPVSDNKFEVEVVYKTSPNSSALQWLEPAQTRDGRLPFMYSQCQAIHARSMFPCQDTPSVKATFDAVVSLLDVHL
ncbi:unnamed protein product [Dicrocoelium dendriticum]|nr:unnamed protein product [Dicrocoelium dendriticum]